MRGKLVLLIACGAIALSGCTRLVFVRGHDFVNPQLYTMRADGTEQLNLSQTEFNSSFPDVSSDGSTVAFSSGVIAGGAVNNVYLMPVSGGARAQLTTGAFQKWVPRWGLREYADRIVYSESGTTGTRSLHIVSTDGAAQLLTNSGTDFSDTYADIYYSALDGKYKVIFSHLNVLTGRSRLFTINVDGSNQPEQLTKDIHDDEDMPVVSHDGRMVAYRAYSYSSDTPFEAIRVISIDNWQRVSEFRLPIPRLINVRGIGWSRSDRKLYVSMEISDITDVHFTEERAEVFAMRPDGSGLIRLTYNKVPDYWPNGIPCKSWWGFVCTVIDVFTGE